MDSTAVAHHYAINVIEDAAHRILLLKRAPDAGLGAGLWGFCGGHIEPGESPEACSRREMREELGGECRLELVSRVGPVRDSFYGGTMEIHLFHYRWKGGDLHLNPEHTGYAWVGPEEYKDFRVMDGIDEDIYYFGIWPVEFLNSGKLGGVAQVRQEDVSGLVNQP